ncbi:MAG: type III-A CRISPR-associated protein Cas10/Csm1 [Hydrogenobacter sp.]
MVKDRLLLAIGGLLHDVGKLLDRAGESADKQDLKYAHAVLSRSFVEGHIRGKISDEDYKKVLSCVEHHENWKSLEQYIYKIADIYSSKERSKGEEEKLTREQKRLRPIFRKLKISNKEWLDKEAYTYYTLKPLSLQEDTIFPKVLEEFKKPEGDYATLLNAFKKEFGKIDFSNLEKAFLRLYHLCYEYLWCVPASTYDTEKRENHYPDISLFDHSRVVSAIACSLWTEYNKGYLEKLKDWQKAGENCKLVLVEGDINGIQRFLFDLANKKGVAKRLRGRSFFLTVLPHLVARKFLWELGYPLCNLLYVGGGKFQLLLGYEEGIENRLKALKEKMERSLVKEFGGKLGLTLTYRDFALKKLENYQELIKEFYKSIEEDKRKKFLSVFESFEELTKEPVNGYVVCPSCGWEVVKEEEINEEEAKFCKWCNIFFEIGGFLPKAEYIVFDNSPKNSVGFYLEDIGGVYLNVEKGKEVYAINRVPQDFSNSDGFIFFANYVPLQGNNVIDFEELAQCSEGDKKLAFVRGDVDNLGFIFMKGFKEEYTISRVATFSRQLDLFFSGYLNELLKDSKIYVLYAGGDDFFLIGPWNEVLDKTVVLYEKFYEYTIYNPDFNISTGIYMAREDFPVRFAGELAGGEEAKVKEAKIINKNKDISVLGELLDIQELKEGINTGKKLAEYIESKAVGRATLYKIYMLTKAYRDKDGINPRFYPMFYYLLYRNVKLEKEELEEFIKLFVDPEKDYQLRSHIPFSIKYAIMKTREVSEGGEKASNKEIEEVKR